MRDQDQLIADTDRLNGRLLRGPLAGLFGGLHVLPSHLPYDDADAGFHPVARLTVIPEVCMGGRQRLA
jgi:sucrose phosphorylase